MMKQESAGNRKSKLLYQRFPGHLELVQSFWEEGIITIEGRGEMLKLNEMEPSIPLQYTHTTKNWKEKVNTTSPTWWHYSTPIFNISLL
jgi:hypothetical protein